MKKVRAIIAWSLIATFFQMAVLVFLDKYYWKSQSSFNIVPVSQNKNNVVKDPDITIPSDAKDVQVSYNGKHMSYLLDGKLTVLDLSTGSANSISLPDKGMISYYKWLPDRDRMIIAEKYTSRYQTIIRFSNYDENSGTRTEIVDNHKQIIKISAPDSKYEVKDMSLSTATSVLYIRISRSGYRNIIYHMNTMNQIRKFGNENTNIENMEALSTEDKLIYESAQYKKLFVAQTNRRIDIPGVKESALLGVDDDDNIYVGSVENGLITNVYYGTLGTPEKEWKSLKLDEPSQQNEIFISRKGIVFVNDNLKGEVLNLSDKSVFKYKGTFVSLFNKGVISINNGKVLSEKF